MASQRPSDSLKDKTNVHPVVNRLTQATAEDFQELGSILSNHAAWIDSLSMQSKSEFYGVYASLAALIAAHPVIVGGGEGFAVINTGSGNPVYIAIFNRPGGWVIQDQTDQVLLFTNRTAFPASGQEKLWYIDTTAGRAYLWYNAAYNPLVGGGATAQQQIIADYPTTTAMKASQDEQTDQKIYKVENADDDPNIVFKEDEINKTAFYQFNGSKANPHIDDYTLISTPYGNHAIPPEYTLSPISGTNKVQLLKEGVSVSEIDLTPYLDDTNLARITDGDLDAETGIVTFTRDDETTFTINLSSLIDIQVQTDFDQEDIESPDYLKNKPTKLSDFENDLVMPSGEATVETGTAIGLGNVLGATDPSPTPYTDDVFTIKPDPVLFGWGTRLWSSAGKTEFATVTGATLIPTSLFEADKLFWVNVVNRGDAIYYWFEAQDAGAGSSGATTFMELTDRASVDLPEINNPLALKLLLKADKLTTYTKTEVAALLENKQFAFIDNFPLEPAHNSATIFNDGKICTIDVNTRTYQDTFTVAAKNESDTVDGSIVLVGKTGWSYQLNDAVAVALTTGSNVTLVWTKGATCTIIKKIGTNKFFIDGGIE